MVSTCTITNYQCVYSLTSKDKLVRTYIIIDVTTFLYCEYNYHCYEYHYNYNTWMYSFQVDSTTNLNMYVSDPSSSKQKVWLRQTTAYYIYLFFNSSSYFSAVLVFKVCKCIFAITTSNYSSINRISSY